MTGLRWVAACGLLAALLGCACAEEPATVPAVPIDFYYSEKDPRLADTEKALAEAVKAIPGLQINRFKIDDPANAKKMSAAEESLGILEPGEMMVVFGPFYLISKGTQRDIENYLLPMLTRVVGQMKGDNSFKGRLKTDLGAYAKIIFGEGVAGTIAAGNEKDDIVYVRVTKDGKGVGWIVDAYYHITCPICNDTQFLIATDDKLTVLDLRPARELERYGRPLSDPEVRTFLAQFKGKTPANAPIKVDGIARATKTSLAYQEALNTVLKELAARGKP